MAPIVLLNTIDSVLWSSCLLTLNGFCASGRFHLLQHLHCHAYIRSLWRSLWQARSSARRLTFLLSHLWWDVEEPKIWAGLDPSSLTLEHWLWSWSACLHKHAHEPVGKEKRKPKEKKTRKKYECSENFRKISQGKGDDWFKTAKSHPHIKVRKRKGQRKSGSSLKKIASKAGISRIRACQLMFVACTFIPTLLCCGKVCTQYLLFSTIAGNWNFGKGPA